MAGSNFRRVMEEQIFPWEGGYVDHPSDPGGATNMGITIHTMKALSLDLDKDGDVDKEDVRNVTKEVAMSIYKNRYWDAVEADHAPSGVDAVLMDGAVNSGPRASVRWVQRALGISDDGILGPITREKIHSANPTDLVKKSVDERLKSVRQFRNYDVFGKGWENRINHLRDFALGLSYE